MQSKSQAPSITTGPSQRNLCSFSFPSCSVPFFNSSTIRSIPLLWATLSAPTPRSPRSAARNGTAGQSLCRFLYRPLFGLRCHYLAVLRGERQNAVSSVHTALAFSLLSGVVIAGARPFADRFSLRAMSLPERCMPEATAYLRIFFLSMIPNLFYNMGAAVLRAIGDSKRPLYFLILSCLCNIVLDLIFVAPPPPRCLRRCARDHTLAARLRCHGALCPASLQERRAPHPSQLRQALLA